jgi:single-strand DNA-binding protein
MRCCSGISLGCEQVPSREPAALEQHTPFRSLCRFWNGYRMAHGPGGDVSRSLNKASLIGNVGQDPEIRTTNNGSRVATFSLATSRTWNGPSGDKQEKTEWHKCVVWNAQRGSGLADVVEKYVRKGEKLYVEGRIEYRQFQDKEGQTRYVTEINVRELMLLGGRGGAAGGGDSEMSAPRSRPAPARSGAAARGPSAGGAGAGAAGGAPAGGGGEGGTEDFEDFPGALAEEDDDLPF